MRIIKNQKNPFFTIVFHPIWTIVEDRCWGSVKLSGVALLTVEKWCVVSWYQLGISYVYFKCWNVKKNNHIVAGIWTGKVDLPSFSWIMITANEKIYQSIFYVINLSVKDNKNLLWLRKLLCHKFVPIDILVFYKNHQNFNLIVDGSTFFKKVCK